MADRILIALVCVLCAVPFYLIAYLETISKTPLHFWNGDEQKLRETVMDVPGYNRKMGAAFRRHGTACLLSGLLGAVSPMAGIIGIIAVCTLGLYLLWRKYRQILSEYS